VAEQVRRARQDGSDRAACYTAVITKTAKQLLERVAALQRHVASVVNVTRVGEAR
jgi:hypothetical protein